MKYLTTLAAALACLLAAAVSLGLVRRYVVSGRSMLRAYAPGDRLLAETLSYRMRTPRIGEVIIVKQANANGRLDLKRLVAGPGATVQVDFEDRSLADGEWYVLGDNLSESQDSRTLGPIKTHDIVGRVWRRY